MRSCRQNHWYFQLGEHPLMAAHIISAMLMRRILKIPASPLMHSRTHSRPLLLPLVLSGRDIRTPRLPPPQMFPAFFIAVSMDMAGTKITRLTEPSDLTALLDGISRKRQSHLTASGLRTGNREVLSPGFPRTRTEAPITKILL